MSMTCTPMINPDYPIRHLVLAIFDHAIQEARKGNDEAREWLYCDGLLYMDIVREWHPDYTRRWLDTQLKRTRKANTSRKNTAQPGRGKQSERMPIEPANVYA